jgi:hypothetical protein
VLAIDDLGPVAPGKAELDRPVVLAERTRGHQSDQFIPL